MANNHLRYNSFITRTGIRLASKIKASTLGRSFCFNTWRDNKKHWLNSINE